MVEKKTRPYYIHHPSKFCLFVYFMISNTHADWTSDVAPVEMKKKKIACKEFSGIILEKK